MGGGVCAKIPGSGPLENSCEGWSTWGAGRTSGVQTKKGAVDAPIEAAWS